MEDELDVEAMLEAPYKKEDKKHSHISSSSSSSSKSKKKKKRSRSRSRERSKRDSGRDKRHGRDEDRDRGQDRHRQERRRSRSREGGRRDRRDGRRSPPGRGRGRAGYFHRHSQGDEGGARSHRRSEEGGSAMTPEERDVRTVFCMQLAASIRAKDLEEFFSSVGKVNDVRMITDNKTRRSKGIAYIEFKDMESVPLAMALTGQKLLGVPILVQPSQAERNRMAMASSMAASSSKPANNGPVRLYVGSLHYNITEEMLKGIFEPFGKVEDVKLMRDHESGRSQGYGFLTYRNPEDAKKAMEQLNGFELAGRPMKVGNVTERSGGEGGSALDTDEMDRAGIGLGATGRLQLMAKLAEGTGFEIPPFAANALSQAAGVGAPPFPNMAPSVPQFPPLPAAAAAVAAAAAAAVASAAINNTPSIATQCFMLSNMFDTGRENRPNWDQEIRDDVIEECNKHGGVLHLFVDKNSPQGNVYVKCPTIAAAVASVNTLHGRYFGGRVISAAYIPLPNYSALFVDSARANQPLVSSSQATANMMSIASNFR